MENRRNTQQKAVIMQTLREAKHPTASELYAQIHMKYPAISRATVFRVLSQFADAGEIRRLELDGSDTRYDASIVPHAHCHCVRCGKITDVFGGEFTSVLTQKSVEGYNVVSAQLEFCGLCPDCSRNNI